VVYFNEADFRSYFTEESIETHLTHDADGEYVLAQQEKGYATGGARGLEEATLHAHQKLYEEGRATDFTLASDYAILNDKNDALQHLEIAYEKRDPMMVSMLGYIDLKNIRQEPDFKNLAAKVGLPQEH